MRWSVWVAVLALAYAANPDEESFKQYIRKSMERDGSSWLERSIVSVVAPMVYKRENYKFFSIVNIPEERLFYLGLFGLWIPLSSFQ